MAWRRPGDKPLSEPMMFGLHIYASLGLNELDKPNAPQLRHLIANFKKPSTACQIIDKWRSLDAFINSINPVSVLAALSAHTNFELMKCIIFLTPIEQHSDIHIAHRALIKAAVWIVLLHDINLDENRAS